MNKFFKIVGIIGEISPPSPTSVFKNYNRQGCIETYTIAIEKNNALPLIIPYIKNSNPSIIKNYISLIDALLIPGGNDADPSLYNEERKEECQKSDKEYDIYCLDLIKEAMKQQKPILGICKGCQLLNIACGGTLFQDSKYDLRESKEVDHSDYNNISNNSHKIIINTNSKLYNIFKTHVIDVNSLHHQSVNKVGKNLILSALSLDGIVEAIETEDSNYFCLGVQWHPETLLANNKNMNLLFQTFIDSI